MIGTAGPLSPTHKIRAIVDGIENPSEWPFYTDSIVDLIGLASHKTLQMSR